MATSTEFATQKDEVALLGSLLTKGMSSAAAQWILSLKFPDEWELDAEELAAKNAQGTINEEEIKRLDSYLHVGDLLGLLQSQARTAAKSPQGA